MSEVLVFFPMMFPLLGGIVAYGGKATRNPGLATCLENAGAAIGFGLSWISLVLLLPDMLGGVSFGGVLGNWHPEAGIAYRFDGTTWVLNLMGISTGTASWLFSRSSGPGGPVFTFAFLIQTGALAATAMTVDLFNLFVCLELLGLASYVLVSQSGKPKAVLAAFSYLLVSAAAMVVFLAGVYVFYRLTGHLSFKGIAEALAGRPDMGGIPALASLAAIMAAVAVRVAIMPLYGWLPDSHALAPHPVSAVLSGVLIKTPLFALGRLLADMPMGGRAGALLGIAGAVTAVTGVALALCQRDAKRLLAYHSISQIGYVVAALGLSLERGLGSPSGQFLYAAALLHALFHSWFKGLLFLSVGHVTDVMGGRNVLVLRGGFGILRSGGENVPLTGLALLVGAVSIAAMPPFSGHGSKAALAQAMDGTLQGWFLLAAGAGTIASFVKLGQILFPPAPWDHRRYTAALAGDAANGRDGRPWVGRVAGLLLLALFCIAGGVFMPGIWSMAGNLLGYELPALELYTWKVWLKTMLTLLPGIAVFWTMKQKPARWAVLKVLRRNRSFEGLFMAFGVGMLTTLIWLVL